MRIKKLLIFLFFLFIPISGFAQFDEMNFVSSKSLYSEPRSDSEPVLSSYGSHFGTKIYERECIGIDEIALYSPQGWPPPILPKPLMIRVKDDNHELVHFDSIKIVPINRGYSKIFENDKLILKNTISFQNTDELMNEISIQNKQSHAVRLHIDAVIYSFAGQEDSFFDINNKSIKIYYGNIEDDYFLVTLDENFSTPYREWYYVLSHATVVVENNSVIKNTLKLFTKGMRKEVDTKRYFRLKRDIQSLLNNDKMLKNAIHTLENSLWKPLSNYEMNNKSLTSVSTKYGYPLMIPWDSAFNALGYATVLEEGTIPQNIIETVLNNQCSNGMVPNIIYEERDLNTCDRSNPPILSWISYEIYKRYKDKAFLEKIYEKLKLYLLFWQHERDKDKDGLLEYDAQIKDERRFQLALYETAWDDNTKYMPHTNGGFYPYNIESLELNSLIYNEYVTMSQIAQELGDENDSQLFAQKASVLRKKINKYMFDKQARVYYDIEYKTHQKIKYLTPHIFFPLFAGIADKETEENLINNYLLNKELFWPSIPTVAFNQPGYVEDGSFHGPTWLQVFYFVYKGVENSSIDRELKEEVLDGMRKFLIKLHTYNRYYFYEKYNSNPDSRNYLQGLGKMLYGWSAAITLNIFYASNH